MKKSEVEEIAKKTNVRTVVLLITLGVSSIVIGYLLESQTKSISVLLIAVGGAVLGAGMGAYVGNIVDESTVHQFRRLVNDLETRVNTSCATIEGMLSQSTAAKILSQEADLSQFRRTIYHYHATIVRSKVIWRHWVCHLGNEQKTPGTLSAIVRVKVPHSESIFSYKIDLIVRDTRLVLISQNQDGNEPCVMYIYPRATDIVLSPKCGIGVIQNWDGNDTFTRCLLAYSPLVNGLTTGEDVPPEQSKQLEELWNQSQRIQFTLLPGYQGIPNDRNSSS
jgi:hypothetical protein